MTTHLILGTAGHIDHGKTTLVKSLTGVDTDRLPEEKRRGITIELGFASLVLGEFHFGIVDVPGHERFIRNMLSGATGIDLALLVVAADDSIKPQTREHLEILKLLGVRQGVIAITKADLAEPDWLVLVQEEITGLVAGSFLQGAQVVPVSSVTGQGMEELKAALTACAAKAAQERGAAEMGPFRMPIDRVFTRPGFGTVVTGSVVSGRLQVGDPLMIVPGGQSVRVRGLHHHDKAVESVVRGQRAAVNLPGVHIQDLQRGQELSSFGHLAPSRKLTAWVEHLPDSDRPLKNRVRVKLHLGTAEHTAVCILLSGGKLAPGDAGLVQFNLPEEVVSTWGQPFVLRWESPAATLGGGRVLQPVTRRRGKLTPAALNKLLALRSPDMATRMAAALYWQGVTPWTHADLALLCGAYAPEEALQQLRAQGKLVTIPLPPTGQAEIHPEYLQELAERVTHVLERAHDQKPLELGFDQRLVLDALADVGQPEIVLFVLRDLIRRKALVEVSRGSGAEISRGSGARGLALAGRGPKLKASEQQLLETLIKRIADAGLDAPWMPELLTQVAKNQAAVKPLLDFAVARGDLVKINADYFVSAPAMQQAQHKLAQAIAEKGGLTVSQIREVLSTTRKFAVPLCEYWDAVGFTARQGDARVLATGRARGG